MERYTAEQVLRGTTLNEIIIPSFSLKVSKVPERGKGKVSITSNTEYQINDEQNKLIVILTLSIVGIIDTDTDTDSDEDPAFQLGCTSTGIYMVSPEINLNQVSDINSSSPYFNDVVAKEMYPVIRSKMQEMLDLSGMRGVQLPWSIQFSPVKK